MFINTNLQVDDHWQGQIFVFVVLEYVFESQQHRSVFPRFQR